MNFIEYNFALIKQETQVENPWITESKKLGRTHKIGNLEITIDPFHKAERRAKDNLVRALMQKDKSLSERDAKSIVRKYLYHGSTTNRDLQAIARKYK